MGLFARRSPCGMYDLYIKNLALHQEVGCDLFAAFSSIDRQGQRWGVLGEFGSLRPVSLGSPQTPRVGGFQFTEEALIFESTRSL